MFISFWWWLSGVFLNSMFVTKGAIHKEIWFTRGSGVWKNPENPNTYCYFQWNSIIKTGHTHTEGMKILIFAERPLFVGPRWKWVTINGNCCSGVCCLLQHYQSCCKKRRIPKFHFNKVSCIFADYDARRKPVDGPHIWAPSYCLNRTI